MCRTTCRDRLIVFSQKRSTMRFQNDDRRSLTKVDVDGCLITTGKRCDHQLVDELNGTEYYVELKGCNVAEALEQIIATIHSIGKADKSNRYAFVVSSKVHPAFQSKRQVQEKRLRQLVAGVQIKNVEHTHLIR
jgi:hypothetical protein